MRMLDIAKAIAAIDENGKKDCSFLNLIQG